MKIFFLYSIVLVLFTHSLILSWQNYGRSLIEEASNYRKTKGNESFQDVKFYVTEYNRPKINMRANRFDVFAQDYAQYLKPEGEIFDEDGNKVWFQAGRGNYSKDDEILNFSERMELDYKDMNLKCDEGRYSILEGRFDGKGNVISVAKDAKTKDEVIVKSEKVLSFPKKKWSRFEIDVDGVIERQRKYEGNFYFQSDIIIANLEISRIDLHDNVRIRRETMDLTSRNSSIFLENYNKELKYYELNDDVVINQKIKRRGSRRFIERVAYSEKLEGHVKDKKVVLTGAPKVVSDGDIIRGSKIVLRENASIIEVIDSTSRIEYKK